MASDTLIPTQQRERTQALLKHLYEGLYEREKAMRLALLTAVAGESLFLLGPPGVGKSLIARRLKYAFKGGTSFEYLMSKFSTPDEIFGPVSIQKLKDEDKYERLTENYLPKSNIVFLDEIWKAGPSIQNALLTILNEKIYRNGGEDMKVDILGIISASNEVPNASSGLAAIWDRFLVRLELYSIRKYQNLLSMITNTEDVYEDTIPKELKFDTQEVRDWSAAINEVQLPPEVLNTVQMVKHRIDKYNEKPNNTDRPLLVYDRRWKKMIRLMRTSAFLNGRSKVDLMDCFLMADCLWSHPEQIETVREMVSETIRKHGYSLSVNLNILRKEIDDFEKDVRKEVRVANTVTEEIPYPIDDQYYEIINDGAQFKGKYIAIKDYRELNYDDYRVTNIYDEQQSLLNRVRVKKGAKAFSIAVLFGDKEMQLPTRTKQEERTEYIRKTPHKVVIRYWQERYENLMGYILEQQERMETEMPEEVEALAQNLFVDSALSAIPTANLSEVEKGLQKLRLKLEKIQHLYDEQ